MSNDNDASSFKYQAALASDTAADGKIDGAKIAVPLKYLSNLWRSLEMQLINCKVDLLNEGFKKLAYRNKCKVVSNKMKLVQMIIQNT